MRKEQLLSVGIDIGTSTTQCVFSSLTLSNTASAFSVPRIQITDKRVVYRAPLRLTPLTSPDTIDAQGVERIVSEDYAAAGIRPEQIRLGAVIITGETARKQNARAVAQALSRLAGDFVVATAGPALESILAGRGSVAAELSRTAATFELHGWVPENRLSDVERAVAGVTDAYCLFTRDPNDDETPPSVVKNNRFVTPFEVVTDLYSRPDPRGMDPTPFMAIPYIVLFGLMLSDSGYGLLLAIGCALFIRLRRPTGMMGGLARVLLWGGLSTIIWGVLVGTVFGLDFDVLLGTDDLFPIILDPMTDPIGMLILCFGLGVVHILFGYGLRVKESFAQGDWQGAVFDTLSWMFIIVGLIAGVGGPMVGLGFLQYPGLILAGIGALLILLFKGRGKRNPIKRTISGLGELYNISGVLSDILSYARLFALGIATGVIASVFNDICSMLMGSPNIILKILGVAVACALLVGLHLFNLAINTLGAFVHCARLQYVEFYGKFYEAGGRTFRPLGYKTKHVQITEP